MAPRPLPVRDDLNRAYWDGAQEAKLVILRCPRCSTYVHPPKAMCPRCQQEKLEPTQVSGQGRVYSWSVMNSAGNPGFEDKLPYTVLIVELAEQPGLVTVGNLIDADPTELHIGAPVEVTYETIDDQVTLPQWRLTPQKGL